MSSNPVIVIDIMFQFQIGAIRSKSVKELIEKNIETFQFQIGAIRRVYGKFRNYKDASFNSKLVRLEVGR